MRQFQRFFNGGRSKETTPTPKDAGAAVGLRHEELARAAVLNYSPCVLIKPRFQPRTSCTKMETPAPTGDGGLRRSGN
jgi:hypothetical protein